MLLSEATSLVTDMGLHPLEFSECYLDSPGFRDKIKAHEAELDKTNRFIKELYKDGKNLINATKRKMFMPCLLVCLFVCFMSHQERSHNKSESCTSPWKRR